jgi:hypothetical protein
MARDTVAPSNEALKTDWCFALAQRWGLDGLYPGLAMRDNHSMACKLARSCRTKATPGAWRGSCGREGRQRHWEGGSNPHADRTVLR